ncbi:MAG: tetratricopeptide repeat protein [Thermotogota bacterium]|nr:tetratricopeptide repeat protein [Thermotogota bacterium]
MSYAIVYLPLKPEIAKSQNLPLKLPVLAEDLPSIEEENTIPLAIILRGLRAQWRAKKDAYYASYLRYFVFEDFKEALKNNRMGEAAQLLQESLEYSKEDYLFHFYNGLFFKKTGDFGKAETELRKSAAMNLANPMVTFELGQLLFELDDLDNALEQFTNTLERDKRFTPAYVACGDIFHRASDYNAAMGFYQKAIEIAPAFVPPYIRLGVIYNKKQNFGKAKVFFERGLKQDTENFQLHYNIAFTYMRLKQPLLSIEHLKKCLEIDSKVVSVYNELSIIYKNLGFFDKALVVLKEGLGIEDDLTLKWHLMQVYAILQQFQKAEGFLQEIARSDHSVDMSDYRDALNKELSIDSKVFSLSAFASWALDVYNDISHHLKNRLIHLADGQQPLVDFTDNFNLEPLPLAMDIIQEFKGYNFTLFRALTLFATQICNNLDWLIFSRFLFVIVNNRFFSQDDTLELNQKMERIADEIIDLDWSLANQLVQMEREVFKDIEELLDQAQKDNHTISLNLTELIILIMNILWVEPTQEELKRILRVYNSAEEIGELCSFLLNRK